MDAPVEVVSQRDGVAVGHLALDLQTGLLGIGIHRVAGHIELHPQRKARTRIDAVDSQVLSRDGPSPEDAPLEGGVVDFGRGEPLAGQRAVDSR